MKRLLAPPPALTGRVHVKRNPLYYNCTPGPSSQSSLLFSCVCTTIVQLELVDYSLGERDVCRLRVPRDSPSGTRQTREPPRPCRRYFLHFYTRFVQRRLDRRFARPAAYYRNVHGYRHRTGSFRRLARMDLELLFTPMEIRNFVLLYF